MHRISINKVMSSGTPESLGKTFFRAKCSCGRFIIEGEEAFVRGMVDMHQRHNPNQDVLIGEPNFISNIDNPNMVWTFNIVGGMKFTGTVIDRRVTPDGLPITIKIHVEGEGVFDIPWTSIQFIQFEE